MARGDTASRIIRLIYLLEKNPKGLTASEIFSRLNSEGFECGKRTVYRDLDVIGKSYFPIVNEGEGERKIWKLNSIAKLSDKIQFSYHELMALFLAKESLQTLKGSALFQHINGFITRLEQALGPGAERELKNLSQYITYRASATWQTGVSEEIINTIYEACYEGYVLDLDYRSKSGEFKDQIKTRKIGPEGLYFADSGVYLIAKDLTSNKFRTYSLHRVVQATRTDEIYDQDKSFSMTEFIRNNFGIFSGGEVEDVEIVIEDPIASYVSERRWHESQQVTRHPGGIHLKMRVNINDELARWILGLGDCATVVAPVSLRKLVEECASRVLIKYQLKKAS